MPAKQRTLDGVFTPSPKKKAKEEDLAKVPPVKELLRPIAEGIKGTLDEQHKALHTIAESLMANYELSIAGSPYQLVEVEAYVYDKEHHPDVYTHRHDDQLEAGSWYFHRQGNGGYKSGTYKGMDLACGSRDRGVYGGFLIRAVLNKSDGTVIEGPCLVVNHILEKNKKSSIPDFAAGRSAAALPSDSTPGLTLTPGVNTYKRAYSAPRVGLTLRKGDEKIAYCTRPYRFSVVPSMLKKYKVGFALQAAAQGLSSSTICNTFGFRPGQLAGDLDIFNAARKSQDLSKYIDTPVSSGKMLAGMVGACLHRVEELGA